MGPHPDCLALIAQATPIAECMSMYEQNLRSLILPPLEKLSSVGEIEFGKFQYAEDCPNSDPHFSSPFNLSLFSTTHISASIAFL